MSRIATVFAKCKHEGRAAFIPFIMAGDPNLEASAKILDALPAAGADIIELGIPFSDPMADGPAIQAAGLRSLQAGTTLNAIIAQAGEFRKKHAQVPLVLMGYLNPVYNYGYEQFAKDAEAAGIDGIIIVDLPPEEADELEPLLTKHGISLVRLIAPTSVPERLPLLVKGASGYLYYVSITGITGAGSATSADIEKNIAAIRKVTDLPIAVGFGVKTAEQVKTIGKLADGVVVGSAIVLKAHANEGDAKAVAGYVSSLAR